MPQRTENPRAILKAYADALVANAQAATEDEQGEIADVLIEITGEMEAHGVQIAQLVYQLLERGTGSAAQ